MTDIVTKRWEEGIAHHPESIALVRLVDGLDKHLALDLKYGGDGDMGETLAYFLDELIDRGMIEIRIK